MSYSADYIKRMLEQFGDFLLGMRKMLDEDQPDQVLSDVHEGYRQLFGVDGEFILNAPEDYLALMTSIGRVGDIDKTIALADLLHTEGDAYALRGNDDEGLRRYVKAMHVLIDTYLALSHDKSADHTERIDALISVTAESELPEATLGRLFRYYEKVGNYAQAEDTLYELLKLNEPTDPEDEAANHAYDEWADEGVAFYKRLLTLDDYTLQSGGLPRAEVQEGLNDLTET